MNKFDKPIADPDTFSIHWNGKNCALGNTKEFRFAERLIRNLNCFVSYNELAEWVWDYDEYDPHKIKNMKLRLKKKLQLAGMEVLADRIESTPQHYRLNIK
jgi:DNA-binding response OmpR family regulator